MIPIKTLPLPKKSWFFHFNPFWLISSPLSISHHFFHPLRRKPHFFPSTTILWWRNFFSPEAIQHPLLIDWSWLKEKERSEILNRVMNQMSIQRISLIPRKKVTMTLSINRLYKKKEGLRGKAFGFLSKIKKKLVD